MSLLHAAWKIIAEVLISACLEAIGALVLRLVTLGAYPPNGAKSQLTRSERVLAALVGLAVIVPLLWLLVRSIARL